MGRGSYYATITPRDGDYALHCSYHPTMVARLKAEIPSSARKWDNDDKVWLVRRDYVDVARLLVNQCLGLTVNVIVTADAPLVEQSIRLEYLGRCKDGVANGHSGVEWAYVFPEPELRRWFNDPARPGDQRDLYAVLGVAVDADATTIRRAYGRLAMQWHPDVCGEPDADVQFKQIDRAYKVLKDDRSRARYDFGLTLQARAGRGAVATTVANSYRTPLRCGLLYVSGRNKLGRLCVETIQAWVDIYDDSGRTMVTSWPVGANDYVVRWRA